MYFPADIEQIIQRDLLFENVSPEEVEQWKKTYVRLVKTAMLKTGGSIFISKNPPNAFRIPLLLEMFPGARFINIFREKEEVLPSFMRFVTEVIKGIGLQKYDRDRFYHSIEKLYDLYLEKYEAYKRLIPPGDLIEIDYPDLLKNNLEVNEMIYEKFGLDKREKAFQCVRDFVKDMGNFHEGSKK
jgi:hypothetical protein